MNILVSISYKDPRPIYEQIRENLRRLIVSGAISPNERLPSVRDLAAANAINPNTIQRAYRELELEGYIYSVPGKGSFACEHVEADEVRRNLLLKTFDEAAAELQFLNVTRAELRARLGDE